MALAERGAEALQAGAPKPAPVQTATGPAPTGPSINDWIERPTEAAQQVADTRLAAALGPMEKALAAATAMNATTQRALAARDHADAFAKWGPEIDGHMAQVAPEHRTLDNYGKVVKFVMGNHLDELVEAKAKAMLASGGLGERSGGSNGVTAGETGAFDPAKLDPAIRALCEKHGIDRGTVREFCRKNNMTEEAWVNGMAAGKMFTSASPFSATMTDAQLGIKGVFGE